MPLPNLSEIDTIVTKNIMPGVADQFFKNDPLLAYLKKSRYFVWTGGSQIQENSLYRPMKGDFYSPGENFDLTQRQNYYGLLFDPKYMWVNVTEQPEVIEVILREPLAAFNKVQSDLSAAAITMSAKLAVALYRHGQNIVTNRLKAINGLEEALTDGVNATWSNAAAIFPQYGYQNRGDVAPTLNSPLGVISSPSQSAMTYRLLEHSYDSCVIGDEHPVIGVTTNRGVGFINENFQPQQRIDVVEPTIGFTGIKFKAATIIASQYCPGQDITQQDVDELGAAIPPAGETFWWLNPGGEGQESALLKLWFSASKKFQFGFTGFKVRQDSTSLAGQILFSGNFTVREPRLMRSLYGFTK